MAQLLKQALILKNSIHVVFAEVRDRLAELGLTQEGLADVVRRGHLAYITCTPNHPPLIPGIWSWGETVRALREYLLPEGWTRCDDNNYSLTVNAAGTFAIAVATGDEGTGRTHGSPTTKAAKGPNTVDAVLVNQMELNLFSEESRGSTPFEHSADEIPRITWILLAYRDRASNEVRCELSLPSSIGQDGRVDRWEERIILGSIPLDGDTANITPPVVPDINVDVKRRA